MVNWRKFSEQLPTNLPESSKIVCVRDPEHDVVVKRVYTHDPFVMKAQDRLHNLTSGKNNFLKRLNFTEWVTVEDFEKEPETVEPHSGELDNISLIKPLLDFSDEGCFYFLQIMQRRKDGNSTHRHTRIIKNYYIRSEGCLDKKYDEIKDLCRFF